MTLLHTYLIKQVVNHERLNDMHACVQDQSEQEVGFGCDQRNICFLKLPRRKTYIRLLSKITVKSRYYLEKR